MDNSLLIQKPWAEFISSFYRNKHCFPFDSMPNPVGYFSQSTLEEARVHWEHVPSFVLFDSGMDEEVRGYAIECLARDSKISRGAFKKIFCEDILKWNVVSPIIEELEKEGLIRVSETAIFLTGKDAAEKSIKLKKFYSPRLIDAILKAGETEFDSFSARFKGDALSLRRAIETKQNYVDCRIYYDGRLKRVPCPS